MTLNGKRDGFEADDFAACARNASLKRGRAAAILSDVQEAVSRWREFAEAAGVAGAFDAEDRRRPSYGASSVGAGGVQRQASRSSTSPCTSGRASGNDLGAGRMVARRCCQPSPAASR